MTILVFANGDISEKEWLATHLDRADAIIAANGGLRHLQEVGRRPDIIVGDMDSSPEYNRGLWERLGTSVVESPTDKDKTDLELALSVAISRFDDDILVFGALGGRLDQTMANLLLLARPEFQERKITVVEKWQRAWVARELARFQGKPGDIVSLLPLSAEVRVARTEGLKWPLSNDALNFGSSRGVSNVMTGFGATVQISAGLLQCIHLSGEWAR